MEILALVEEMNQLNKSVLVEGKDDVGALRSAGVVCTVLTLPDFEDLVEKGEIREVVVLTDLDRAGDEHLKRLLRKHGSSVVFLTGVRQRLRRTRRCRRGMRRVSEIFRAPES